MTSVLNHPRSSCNSEPPSLASLAASLLCGISRTKLSSTSYLSRLVDIQICVSQFCCSVWLTDAQNANFWLIIAIIQTTFNKHPLVYLLGVTIWSVLWMESITLSNRISLTGSSFVYDNVIAVWAINSSSAQHGFMMKAFISRGRKPIRGKVFLGMFSSRCRSVLVQELRSTSAESKMPRVGGTTCPGVIRRAAY